MSDLRPVEEEKRETGYSYSKENHFVAGETWPNSSKSPGSQTLYRLLPY